MVRFGDRREVASGRTKKDRNVRICSWNVRGVKDPSKRQAIFSEIKLNGSKILCLQETHLERESVKVLEHKKYRIQYHSAHTSYSRGVSILIESGVVFSCRQNKTDENGRYIFLYCMIEECECVLANVYIPPPFKLDVLCDLMRFVAGTRSTGYNSR